MSNFTNKVLTALKEKFISVNPGAKFDSVMTSPKGKFYLDNLDGNLFEPMLQVHQEQYNRGSGKELNEKMRALHSSSAMTTNLLGNNSIVFKTNLIIPKGTYSIEYEKQLRTLKVKGQPANLDAQLLCFEERTVVFCEMKMTEWLFNSPGKLRNAYLKQENYYYPESFLPFNQVFQSLIACPPARVSDNKCIYRRYDAFQMMKHTLGIYNAMRSNEYDEFNKVRLINCIWQINNHVKLGKKASDTYMKYHSQELIEFEDFKIKIQPIISLFADINIDFDVVFLSFDEFLNIAEKPDEQIIYLERYFI